MASKRGGEVGENEKILKIHDVIDVVKMSRSSIYNMINRGDFPKPLKLGERSSGWLRSEVYNWIEMRASSRFPGGAA